MGQRLRTLGVALAALAAPALSGANVSVAAAQGPSGVVRGTVVSGSTAPVEGAEVAITGMRRSVRTDASGFFRVTGLEPGVHTITVRKIGFTALTQRLSVPRGDSLIQRFNLGRPQVLDSVRVVTARSGIPEFEERRASRVGYFITREELERNLHRKMGDMLRGVPGLRITENPQDRSEAWAMLARGRAVISNAGNPACMSMVYIDGAPVYDGPPQPPFNLNTLNSTDLAGVEYYAGGSSIPAKYNRTGSSCGVLIFWTRR